MAVRLNLTLGCERARGFFRLGILHTYDFLFAHL